MTQPSAIAAIALSFPGDKPPPSLMAHERETALSDLKESGSFQPKNDNNAPYRLHISLQEQRLVFDIKNADDETLPSLILSMNPYRRIIRDYFMMMESFETVRREGNHQKLEPIDMARRGLHNEAAELLQERLADKITIDFDTARRLFTLICSLSLVDPAIYR